MHVIGFLHRGHQDTSRQYHQLWTCCILPFAIQVPAEVIDARNWRVGTEVGKKFFLDTVHSNDIRFKVKLIVYSQAFQVLWWERSREYSVHFHLDSTLKGAARLQLTPIDGITIMFSFQKLGLSSDYALYHFRLEYSTLGTSSSRMSSSLFR